MQGRVRAEKAKNSDIWKALLSFIDSPDLERIQGDNCSPCIKSLCYILKNCQNSVPGNLVADCLEFSRHKNAIHEIMETMQGKNVLVFYPYELFAKHKYEPYFYPKQNFHWSGKKYTFVCRHATCQSWEYKWMKIFRHRLLL